MSLWEGLLLAVAVLVAVRALVGMMRRRADAIFVEVQQQVEEHVQREQKEKKKRAVSR